MLARDNENFRAPGERSFSLFQVENIPWCKSCVLVTSPLLNITKRKSRLAEFLKGGSDTCFPLK